MRQRNNEFLYELSVNLPVGGVEHKSNIQNLQDIADYINTAYFNGFEVVSRSMVSNWIYAPDNQRRAFANRFNIKRIKTSTNSYPISA